MFIHPRGYLELLYQCITFDEDQIADYLDNQEVTHLVVFPDWYPTLTENLVPIFSTGAAYALSMGENNMTVYIWP